MTRTSSGKRPPHDRDAAEASRTAVLEALHTQLAERVGSLDSSQEWVAWLRFANSFHRYSFNNTVLIWSQNPEATMVAGYRAWQAKGRQVRRGETAIRVLGPVTTREATVDEQGNPVRGADGKPIQEVRIVGVKPVSVFDVSQTDGDPLPEPPQVQLLRGEAPAGLWDALQGFVESQGFTVSRGNCPDEANGVTMFAERQVRVRADVDDAQAVKTLAHEAGHVLLHAPDQRGSFACRGIVEVEAESVAFMVTAAHGLDASQYTFTYVTSWAHEATTPDGPSVEDIVRSTGQRVIGATDRILRTTQPAPTLVDEALSDLAVQVTRSPDRSAARPGSEAVTRFPASARPAIRKEPVGTSAPEPAPVWEQVATRPPDGAAQERRQTLRPSVGGSPGRSRSWGR